MHILHITRTNLPMSMRNAQLRQRLSKRFRFCADLNAEMVFGRAGAINLCLGTRGEIGQRAISH